MKNVDWKDVAIRSMKTFIEVFLTYLATALSGVEYSDGSVKSTITIGAILCTGCTALTAVINGVILPAIKSSDKEG